MSTGQDYSFQIFVALPTDDVCTVKGLSSEMFVYDLKSRIELKAGIPGDIFNLFFMNSELSDKETLKTYNLKNGCIVRIKIEQNWIGLFEACWRGDIYDVFENGVQFLDETKFEGYNISLWNKLVIRRATYALFIACHRGYLGLILELINRGATDINGKTIFGRTALHVAAYQGFVGCVSLLLSEGAVCNQIDTQGKTPLALSSENGHVYCERRLWLYQWSLKTFSEPSRRWSKESSCSREYDERNGRNSPKVTKLPSTRRTPEEPDLNNNTSNDQKATVHQLHLPRVKNDDDEQHTARSNNDEPRLPSPFPLVQVVEKHRKEFQAYNEGTFHLPKQTQNESKKEEVMENQDFKVPEIKTALMNEIEIVEEANNRDNKSGVGDLKREVESDFSGHEEKGNDQAMDDNGIYKRHTGHQALDNRITDESKLLERPPSGKPNGTRKLDILMTKSRAERLRMSSLSHEQDRLLALDDNESQKNLEQKQESTLTDFGNEYSCKKPVQSFQDWLQMKQSQEKKRPSTAPAQKSRLGKSIDPDCFKKWLNNKRHQRTHSNSESSTTNKKAFISSGGLTFERWLESKSANSPFSGMSYVTDSRDATSLVTNKVRKQVSVAGKPFEVWLAEKKTLERSTQSGENNREHEKYNSRSGKRFEVWLQEKHKQEQIELVQKITTEKEKQRLAELDRLQKWLNPHYKTYEDWLAIKNQQARFERSRTQNEPKEEISEEEKQKDAKVVYNIWQTMKALQELSDEERKYKEMKTKWAAKQRTKCSLQRVDDWCNHHIP